MLGKHNFWDSDAVAIVTKLAVLCYAVMTLKETTSEKGLENLVGSKLWAFRAAAC